MAEAGVLRHGERAELIDGDVIPVSPIGSRHAGAVRRLSALFQNAVGDRAIVSPQCPVRLDQHSEPEPDVALLRFRPDCYASDHPGPQDVLLVVEVMDSTAANDRGVKLALYARFAVSEVWLVDLKREQIESYRAPSGECYTERAVFPRGIRLAPAALPDVVLPVDGVLG